VIADEWLATLFDPALGRESLAYTSDADLLRAQLRALHDCGVLREDAFVDAQQRLDDAVTAAHQRARFDIQPPQSTAPPPAALLEQVLAVGQPLADIDAMTFILTSVELWDNQIDLFFAAVPTDNSDRLDSRTQEALLNWAAKHEAGFSGEGTLSAPLPRSHRLFEVDLRLRDNLGTDFHMMGGGAGGGRRGQWRMHRTYKPGLPLSAAYLLVEIADSHGDTVTSLRLAR
jgi:hypothetical protein